MWKEKGRQRGERIKGIDRSYETKLNLENSGLDKSWNFKCIH